MLFCQVWIARRATTSNLTKPQTFPLEKPRRSYSGLRCSLVFWMSLYKDYIISASICPSNAHNMSYLYSKNSMTHSCILSASTFLLFLETFSLKFSKLFNFCLKKTYYIVCLMCAPKGASPKSICCTKFLALYNAK